MKLSKEEIRADDFLQENINSPNGHLVRILVERLFRIFDDVPDPYLHWLRDLSVGSSVGGYLQPRSMESLTILRNFCSQSINLRTPEQANNLSKVQKELPAIWSTLLNILNLEKLNFLPDDVSNIVQKLITMKTEIISKAPERFSENYIYLDWEEEMAVPETALQFYPNWKLFR